MPDNTYDLTLGETYYNKGFFNLGIGVSEFIRKDEGIITIFLGEEKERLIGKVDRSANSNGTPRIFGGRQLKKWFQRRFTLFDSVQVTILRLDEIWLHKATKEIFNEKNVKDTIENNIQSSNFQRIGSTSNTQVGRDFETIAQEYFASKGIILNKHFCVPIGVGEVKKNHIFDLGSENPKTIVECKSHKWTSGNNVPSAKMTVWNEAMFFFALAPMDYRKILFVIIDYNEKRGETLVAYYHRTYKHLIPPNVEIWEYDQTNNSVHQIK